MMVEKIKHALKGSKISTLSYGFLFISCLLVLSITYVLYLQTQSILEDKLKERLIAIVNTSTLLFDISEINAIQGPQSVQSEEYFNTVTTLQDIRNYNQDITYAYIFRPTDNPDIFTYVADADSLDPDAKVDLDGDGKITEEDALNTPGDAYDVSEMPALRNTSLIHPTTDEELTSDQWGVFLSAYAPLKKNGETIAILGIDVEVTAYSELISKTFFPFLIFVIFLLFLLATLTFALVKIWNQQVESIKELDRQKDELLSIVSHQLATPISSLRWYTEMIMDGDLGKINKKQKKHLISMLQVSENLSDLVSMILDVSRIQLGRVRIEQQDLNLNDFFKEILEIIKPKATEKGVKFIVKLPAKLPIAMLDKRYTRMTIENLLSNAIKYTPKGGEVRFLVAIENGKLICEISDTGCGIPKEEQSKIFGKLFRASNVRNDIDGNGFGLFIAKGAVEAQNGKIWFESKQAKGTSFYVKLPI